MWFMLFSQKTFNFLFIALLLTIVAAGCNGSSKQKYTDGNPEEQQYIEKLNKRKQLRQIKIYTSPFKSAIVEGEKSQTGDLAVIGRTGKEDTSIFFLTSEGKVSRSIKMPDNFKPSDITVLRDDIYALDFLNKKVLKTNVKGQGKIMEFKDFNTQTISLAVCGNRIMVGGHMGNMLVIESDKKGYEVVLPKGEDWKVSPLCVKDTTSEGNNFIPAGLLDDVLSGNDQIYLLNPGTLKIEKSLKAFDFKFSSYPNGVYAISHPDASTVFVTATSSDRADGNSINALDINSGISKWIYRPKNLGRRYLEKPVLSPDKSKLAVLGSAVLIHDPKSQTGISRLPFNDFLILLDSKTGKELKRINLGGKGVAKERIAALAWDKSSDSIHIIIGNEFLTYTIADKKPVLIRKLPFEPFSSLGLVE